MVKICGLIVMMVCVQQSAYAQRHYLKPLKSLVNRNLFVTTKRFENTWTTTGYSYVLHNDITKKYGNFLRAECPKDDTLWFNDITGLCKAVLQSVIVHKQEKIQLTYDGGADFDDADVDQAIRPIIPNVTHIQGPKDILKIAKFYKEYANYMTVEYLRTQEIIPVHVNIHRIALHYEPAQLLDLVRPGEPKLIKERLERRIKRGLDNLYRNEEGLIVALYMSEIDCSFKNFHYEMWQQWYPPHKDLVDAILNFAHLLYKKPLTIDPYPTEKSFNADLMSVDPEFKNLFVPPKNPS